MSVHRYSGLRLLAGSGARGVVPRSEMKEGSAVYGRIQFHDGTAGAVYGSVVRFLTPVSDDYGLGPKWDDFKAPPESEDVRSMVVRVLSASDNARHVEGYDMTLPVKDFTVTNRSWSDHELTEMFERSGRTGSRHKYGSAVHDLAVDCGYVGHHDPCDGERVYRFFNPECAARFIERFSGLHLDASVAYAIDWTDPKTPTPVVSVIGLESTPRASRHRR